MIRRLGRRAASPLLRRILLINLIAPVVLAVGLIGLDKYRQGLIEARLDALAGQAELVAGALGEAAILGGLDPEGLDAEAATHILLRLVGTRRERARLFDDAGTLVVDTRRLADAGRKVEAESLPPPGVPGPGVLLDRALRALFAAFGVAPEAYVERAGQSAADYAEVLSALDGEPGVAARARADGAPVLAAAVPVQRLRKVLGALMLSVEAADIEEAVAAERGSILLAFALTLAVTVAASILLAAWIARPIHRLAVAADEVRTGLGRRAALPDFSERGDEIGELSQALGRMTEALYARLDAIEAFAADVAHELRGPLASLRSAVEALSMTADEGARRRLVALAVGDVRRIDHLISDIADASRLDAEMSREKFAALDLAALARAVAEASTASGVGVDVVAPRATSVQGIETALARALGNLVDNAASFSPPGAPLRIAVGVEGREAVVAVEDRGPGIPLERREKVFERFYTDRPGARPGETHSGLGLAIARRIAEAHGGSLSAEAPTPAEGGAPGARLVLRLPLAGS
jgi:two-component system sensor histidine kinase ChvG